MEKIHSVSEIKHNFTQLYGKIKLEEYNRYARLMRKLKSLTGEKGCYVASSSGRVELVGNHTDHNGGKVLGATVNLDIAAAFLPNDDNKVLVRSKGYADIAFDLSEIGVKEKSSRGMVKGVLFGLRQRGYNIGGFTAVMSSTVPSGGGVSSSAAFQLLMCQIQNHLYNDGKIDAETLARVGQFAENEYFEKPCGLLDQGVIACGNVVLLDFKDGFACKSLQGSLEGYGLVLVDSGGSHAKLTEQYAAIPAEMKAVAAYFGKERLADVDEGEFFAKFAEVTEKVGQRPALRAKHFFEENKRVERAAECFERGDGKGFAVCLDESGRSSAEYLQNCDYPGSDGKLMQCIERARKYVGQGAVRVHGGGFAGGILCVVPKERLKKFTEEMARFYGKKNVRIFRIRTVGATVLQ